MKQIVKIEKSSRTVYDLSVRQNHNFINGGTVLHNCDYRGEIGVILASVGTKLHTVNAGDRIAQAVLNRVETANFHVVAELPTTERGTDGFGSTG